MTPTTPERMPLLHHPVPRPLRAHRQAVELTREAGREVADVDHLLHFAVPLGADLPHLERHEIAERLLHLAQRVAQVAHELAALRRGRHPPRLEGGDGVADHLVVRLGRRLQHARNRLARRRVVRHELLGVRVADPAIRARRRALVHVLELQLREQRWRGDGGGHESSSLPRTRAGGTTRKSIRPVACSLRRMRFRAVSSRISNVRDPPRPVSYVRVWRVHMRIFFALLDPQALYPDDGTDGTPERSRPERP